ncbi:MAG: hypothetical protein COB85_01305 [Bacteroidetes bacterium]|nr:MAG: hypothetical protein COB85_01305 [Bacteroidota bacterium]
MAQNISTDQLLIRAFKLAHDPSKSDRSSEQIDSVEHYYSRYLANAENSDTNYSLGLFLASDYYASKRDSEKEEKLLMKFLKQELPIQYSITLEIDLKPRNYFVRVNERLAIIRLKQKKYAAALEFMQNIQDKSLSHFCGNYHLTIEPKRADLVSDIYIGLNKPDSAIDVMLPYIFNEYNRDLTQFNKKLIQLLSEKYGAEKVRIETEKAFREFYGTVQHSNDTILKKDYYVNLFGTALKITKLSDDASKDDELDIIRTYSTVLWESNFYKQLEEE